MLRGSRNKRQSQLRSNLRQTRNSIVEMVEQKISIGDLSKKCRACLENGKIPIHQKKFNTVEAIKHIGGVDVAETDNLPKYLCRKCYASLRAAFQFRQLIQKSDQVLKEMKVEAKLETNYDDNDDHFTDTDFIDIPKPSQSVYQRPEECSENILNIKVDKSKCEEDSDLREPKQKAKTKCDICNKEISKYYYKEHTALVHGIGKKKQKAKTQCKLCNKTVEKSYYKTHLSAVHEKEASKHICHVCGKTFKYQSGYNTHILSHENEFPFKCQLCSYRGRHSGLLAVHMKTHTRDYKYQCTICSARVLTNGNLHRHMLKHKERSYKCDSCSRAFHSKLEMERHFQVDHLGIKNHVCNICDKAFGYRSAMMKHQLHVHKRQKMLNGRMPSYLEVERKELAKTGNQAGET